MKYQINIIVGILFVLVIASCTSQSASFTSTPIFTPRVTATPIEINGQSLENALTEYLNLTENCETRYISRYPKLVFSEVEKEFDFEKEFIAEQADSANQSYRAYIVQEYVFTNTEIYSKQTGYSVYIDNKLDGNSYRVSWKTFPPDRSIAYYLIWAGENILLIREANSDLFYLVLGIDIEKQEFVYFTEISCGD